MSGPGVVVNDIDPLREERAGRVREVGSHAIWSLSSCKPSKNKCKCIFYHIPCSNKSQSNLISI